jgi:tripartite-type tricarboxylate transporter receptor subunit TctC
LGSTTVDHGAAIEGWDDIMTSDRLFGMITLALYLVSAGLGISVAGPASAQDYPQKLIRMIVPGGAGGPADILARVVAQRLQGALGQSVIVENIPGAGGMIAARTVARAAPDGHTLFFGNTTTLAIIPAISKSPGYDPREHFVAVAKIADTFQVLVVERASAMKSVPDLIARAKANPGQLNIGAVHATLPHLAAELFKSKAGIDIVSVTYKTEPENMTALLSKQIQLSFPNVTTALPLVEQGTLKALAVTSTTPRPQFPGVPTMIESGVDDYEAASFFGVVAPAGTPTAIVNKLNLTINQGLSSNEVQSSLAKFGAYASAGTPQAFAAFIAAETQKWTTVAATAGMRID